MQAPTGRNADRDIVGIAVDEVQVKGSVDELVARRQFHALIAPYMSTLKARAIQLCRSHCDADDLIQDTLLRAFATRSQLKDVTRARPWLLTILTHTFIDAVRKRRRRPDTVPIAIEDEIPDSVPDEPAVWHSIGLEDLRAAIERLPDDVRDTYRMYSLEGHDHATIAKAQRIAIATVGTRIFRARKQLRLLLVAAALQAGSL
jgi:RNA polymerase sigma-70 factor, ECF subfamily